MISFYPGPSKTDENLGEYLSEAASSGILSCNHRSPSFMKLMKDCIKVIKQKLEIPKNYEVFFTSSATECWEITAQSFPRNSFLHVYNGAFGEKWFSYNSKINKAVKGLSYPIHRSISLHQLDRIGAKTKDVICITSCETSNTTKVHQKTIRKIKNRYPESLLFIDATSSMSGITLDWISGDIWYASVQKCFGLPPGLAVMVCSPKAIEKASKDDFHYNSLQSIYQNTQKFQTTHTPNSLGIYLLYKSLSNKMGIKAEQEKVRKRMKNLVKQLKLLGYDFVVPTKKVQSETVIGIKCKAELLPIIKEKAKQQGITLGNGYGKWKLNSFRIANFPAHSDSDFEKLLIFLKSEDFNKKR
ncbi:aminotransferase class V-fold PLP-dependent enzyme [Flammeovirga kamogawensis]|uniref:Aminotransferase class V-fold PLP-dependent enzyme n=1 Tax=Flammeovirga kamogawensis TaxID=373891 RepID=A0ABX8GZR0_9BACT|nr:aminotransferase class V-fold PLP-dependent enzyme [Flammeovirga kamogawensis]MBB6459277.1 phosphoserine aminotransferase [Flammeovirga kamogawensis]QWG08837.1 aminotransferase class V-fold PLP-dependent enzyme [Flammeovirga kamogawensis]TRX67127.1 alanine--glyoxylate aminotransferase family protein [Flammeovirga kamogawensis]